MTRIVAMLESKGLVHRDPHPDDRRQVVVRQTEQAETMLEESRARRNAFLAELMATLSEEERAVLRRRRPSWRSSLTPTQGTDDEEARPD